ncbi:hypothetical protein ACWD48_13095 [Streptomyces sp. NPDC002519]
MLATEGQGIHSLSLPTLKKGRSHLTIKVACIGNGKLNLSDGSGGLVMNVAACDGRAVYTTDFESTPADRLVKLRIEPTAKWQIAAWAEH